MTKRWSSVRSNSMLTKRAASKRARQDQSVDTSFPFEATIDSEFDDIDAAEIEARAHYGRFKDSDD